MSEETDRNGVEGRWELMFAVLVACSSMVGHGLIGSPGSRRPIIFRMEIERPTVTGLWTFSVEPGTVG